MKNGTVEHISAVIQYLNNSVEYAILRNYQGLPDKNASRDIDIIISRKSLIKIKEGLINLIDQSGWKIITYLNSDRLITYVCAKSGVSGTEIVQWDFFVNTSVFGILLMDAEEFLMNKKYNGFLYYVDIECEFLDKYLYNRAVGSQYPQKYQATRELTERTDVVKKKLYSLYGVTSVKECDCIGGKKLLVRAIWTNLRKRPARFLIDIIRFLYTFIKNYVCSNTGFAIGLTGPDGSGKTTVIELILEQLAPVFGTAHKYYHFRPQLFGNLGEVAHAARIKKEVDCDFNKPHRGSKTGLISSFARLLYYTADYILGYMTKVKTVIRITRIIVFDRYYTDIIVDSRRSRIYLNYKLLYWFGRFFVPSLDYNILLTAGSEVILKRKQELDSEGICSINEKIEYLSTKEGYSKVLNESIPEDAVEKILSYIFEQQHQKNLKRLK